MFNKVETSYLACVYVYKLLLAFYCLYLFIDYMKF